ncbi:MAG: hypothetical protein R3Y58_11880 [Eubacteriales bacterium]
MKQAVAGFGLCMILLLTVCSVMALEKDSIELQDLEKSVEVAIYQSLEEGMSLREDPGMLFEKNLKKMLDEESLDISILASDYDEGILSVFVTKEYLNFGHERSVDIGRTVIYEREV